MNFANTRLPKVRKVQCPFIGFRRSQRGKRPNALTINGWVIFVPEEHGLLVVTFRLFAKGYRPVHLVGLLDVMAYLLSLCITLSSTVLSGGM